MSPRRSELLIASIAGFTGVLAGTFGAHGLRGRLGPDMLEVFEVGVRYHLIHAVALLALALAPLGVLGARARRVSVWAFAVGVLIFAGSLYALAISGQKWLGMIAPIGGTAFLAGWFALGVAAIVRAAPAREEVA